MAEMDAVSARALAGELETLRDDALKRGAGTVGVGDLAARISELRLHARAEEDRAVERSVLVGLDARPAVDHGRPIVAGSWGRQGFGLSTGTMRLAAAAIVAACDKADAMARQGVKP